MEQDAQKEALYREYSGKVYGYIRSRISDTQIVEDLVSDVFVKIYEKLHSFDESRASLSTWIYTIARNTLTDYFRTRKQTVELIDTQESIPDAEDDLCRVETLETLAKALETLDRREREIVILHFYSGKTLKEIAAQLHISYAYVKVLQVRAFAKLKKFF